MRKTVLKTTKTNKNDIILRHCCLFTAKMPFDLPSESESVFTTNPNPDSIITYPLKACKCKVLTINCYGHVKY